MGMCVFSLPTPFVMIERIHILCLIIIIKLEVWTITHCLGLGHETMVCAVRLSIFLHIALEPLNKQCSREVGKSATHVFHCCWRFRLLTHLALLSMHLSCGMKYMSVSVSIHCAVYVLVCCFVGNTVDIPTSSGFENIILGTITDD